MITQEILWYIKTEREKKTADSVIKSNLLANGWSASDIDEAISSLAQNPTPEINGNTAVNQAEIKKYRRDSSLIIFGIWIVIEVFFGLMTGALSIRSGGFNFFIIIGFLLVTYLSAFIASSGMVPHKKGSTLEFIGRTIATGALILLIGGGVFFASCLLLLKAGSL